MSQQHPSEVIQKFALISGLGAFPFMLGLLFSAIAEAFLGAKEPMFEMLAGLLLGVLLAACFGVLIATARDAGRFKLANCVLIAIILFDLSAIAIARWLIRLAYASPSNVIELW